MNSEDFLQRLAAVHAELGLPADYSANCRLPLCTEPDSLVDAGPDQFGRPQKLDPRALVAWQAMQAAAARDGVRLAIVSAFRGLDYQAGLIRRKLEGGQSLAEILAVVAVPGFSEHHTGRAIDVGTDDCPAVSPEFEQTPAYHWLQANASDHGFTLSYPRGNQLGIDFEPWHWCYSASTPEADPA